MGTNRQIEAQKSSNQVSEVSQEYLEKPEHWTMVLYVFVREFKLPARELVLSPYQI